MVDKQPTKEDMLESYNRTYHESEFIVCTSDCERPTTMFFDGVNWFRKDGVCLGEVKKWAKFPT